MNIAIASDQNMSTEHFGRCEAFELFKVENRLIVHKNTLQNPGHVKGMLPVLLRDNNVDVLITGGIGGSALRLFESFGIEVVLGVFLPIHDAIDRYLSGNLPTIGSPCTAHLFHKECNEE